VCSHGRDASIDSALSFAVNGLGVQSLVICGHSNCGAMKALLAEADGGDNASLGPAFGQWLDHARPSYTELLAGHPVGRQAAAAGYSTVDQLAMVNVAVQLAKLRHHPVAGPELATGKVQATGLFYDIATAQVLQITADGVENLDPAFGAGIRGNIPAGR